MCFLYTHCKSCFPLEVMAHWLMHSIYGKVTMSTGHLLEVPNEVGQYVHVMNVATFLYVWAGAHSSFLMYVQFTPSVLRCGSIKSCCISILGFRCPKGSKLKVSIPKSQAGRIVTSGVVSLHEIPAVIVFIIIILIMHQCLHVVYRSTSRDSTSASNFHTKAS